MTPHQSVRDTSAENGDLDVAERIETGVVEDDEAVATAARAFTIGGDGVRRRGRRVSEEG